MNYDIIIIGAGLGGLTAGAKLAKEGKKVLLVEQHFKPGGCATIFKRKDYIFEVGLHEMDGLSGPDMKIRIFKELGVFDKVEFLKVPEFFHFVNNDVEITMPHDPAKAIEVLSNAFPNEKEGIITFFDLMKNARKKVKEESLAKLTIGEYLDSIIKNENLKLVLLGNLGYFHDDPYSLSLIYYTIAQSSYFAGGGNFVKGGSQELSNYLSSFITENNGKVILKHEVTEIITEGNKAVGIKYKPVSKKSNTEEIAYGNTVIANAALPNVANNLLPADLGDKIKQNIGDLELGASLLTVYFGFNKALKDIGSKYYSTFIYDGSVRSQADIKSNNSGSFNNRSFTFVDYSQVDSGLCSDDKSVGVVCCIDYISDWEDLSEEEYKKKKEEVAQIFINKLEKLIPGTREHIDYYEVGTSKTVKSYTMNPKGAVYGFAQTKDRIKHELENPVENLHFASAWTKIGGGFSGAIMSGYLCAMNILRKERTT